MENKWLKQQLTYKPILQKSSINFLKDPIQEQIIIPKQQIQVPELEGYKPEYSDKEESTIKVTKEETKYPSIFHGKSEFIKVMTPIYERLLKNKGIDPTFAKALVQQSGLESNWGKSQSGKYNFGGIKGKGTVRKTREVIDGKSQYINDSFRDFNSLEDYANFHIDLLNNNRYKAFSGNIYDFADKVARGGYATDPNYSHVLNKLIQSAKNGIKIPKYQTPSGGLPTPYKNPFMDIVPKDKNPRLPTVPWPILPQFGYYDAKAKNLDYWHKFGNSDNVVKEYVEVMYPIFKQVFEEKGIPLDNLENVLKQSAHESSYGTNQSGTFNLGGITWNETMTDRTPRQKDSRVYIDFDNLYDYAQYKVSLLNDRYEALGAKNIYDFINRLHGGNPGKHNYSEDKKGYERSLPFMHTLEKYIPHDN